MACPVTAGVMDHLLGVGEGLMKNEVLVYEQGVCVCVCVCVSKYGTLFTV